MINGNKTGGKYHYRLVAHKIILLCRYRYKDRKSVIYTSRIHNCMLAVVSAEKVESVIEIKVADTMTSLPDEILDQKTDFR
jgi:hypothetical protein